MAALTRPRLRDVHPRRRSLPRRLLRGIGFLAAVVAMTAAVLAGLGFAAFHLLVGGRSWDFFRPGGLDVPDGPAILAQLYPQAGSTPAPGQPWVLVIGDSVSFGLTADSSRLGHNDSWAAQIEPMLAATGRPWAVEDLACPGETTQSYAGQCPFAMLAPWLGGGSQRQAALRAIHLHPSTLQAIVVELGANDLLDERRDPTSARAAIATLGDRLGGIVDDLETAAPGVPLVLADLYDPNTTFGDAVAVDQGNRAIATTAAAHGARLADWHAAINGPASALGLLVDLAHGDIHPTVGGHRELALAVLRSLPGGLGGRTPQASR